MRLDHLSYAAGPDGLLATTQRLSAQLGTEFHDGGVHPRFGTRNQILPLAAGHYLEVVEVLDHPAADRAPFGQAVRARTEVGGGWLGWAVAVEDLTPVEQRLGRQAVPGNRRLPDGEELLWRQVGVRGLQSDPQLPYFLQWQSDPDTHPSVGGGDVRLLAMDIAGDAGRLDDWLGGETNRVIEDVRVEWCAPNDPAQIVTVTFDTRAGQVRI